MSPTTANGLRYPTTQDLLADTNLYINQLRDDVAGRLSQVRHVVRTGVLLTPDANGAFTLPISDFAVLRGVVFLYFAEGEAWAIMPVITAIAAQSLSGVLWYQDRDTAAGANPTVHPLGSSCKVTYLAWGDPR